MHNIITHNNKNIIHNLWMLINKAIKIKIIVIHTSIRHDIYDFKVFGNVDTSSDYWGHNYSKSDTL